MRISNNEQFGFFVFEQDRKEETAVSLFSYPNNSLFNNRGSVGNRANSNTPLLERNAYFKDMESLGFTS